MNQAFKKVKSNKGSHLYEKLESEGRNAEARATVDRMKAIDPNVLPRSSGTHRTQRPNDLVFLDLSEAESRPPHATNTPPAVRPTTPVIQPNVPALEGLMLTFLPNTESEQPAESQTAASPPPAEEAPPTVEIEVAAGFQATNLAGEPASLDIPDGGTERTGEFEAVPAPIPEFSAESHDSPGSLAHLPADTPEAVDVETSAPVEANGSLTHNPPGHSVLSGIEFADLELAEAVRSSEPRAHDLALQTDLPHLGAQTGMDTPTQAESLAPTEQPPGSVESPSAPSDAELAREAAGFDDWGAGAAEESRPEAGVEKVAPEGSANSLSSEWPLETPEPVELSDAPPLDGVQAGNADELLGASPSFGEEDVTDGRVFPPIPGLSDEAPSESVTQNGETIHRRPGRKLLRDRRRDGESARVADEEPDHLRLEDPDDAGEERVEAPLPDGFEGLLESDQPSLPESPTPEEAVESSKSEDSAEPADATPITDPSSEPRLVASFGGAEGQLRSRLELDPENWMLRRQLGEELLDVGNRDEGLYELELAMAGYDLSGQLEHAQEIVEEIIRVLPTSVRHHQKRVEYAVRSHHRPRLIDAYLELADTLFRTGAGDRSITVYARVLELDPNNDRALFAMATLAPDQLELIRGALMHPGRWSQELDSIPEGGAFVQPLESATIGGVTETPAGAPLDDTRDVAAVEEPTNAGEEAAASQTFATTEGTTPAADEVEPPMLEGERADARTESAVGSFEGASLAAETHEPSHDETERSESGAGLVDGTTSTTEAGESTPLATQATEWTAPPQDDTGDDARVSSSEEEHLPEGMAESGAAEEPSREVVNEAAEVQHATPAQWEPEAESPAETMEAAPPDDQVAEVELSVVRSNGDQAPLPGDDVLEVSAGQASEVHHDTPILNRAASLTPADANGGDFLDLGEWLRTTEPTRSTRMVVDDSRPTGDEQADFDELLRRFKRGLAENVDAEDYAGPLRSGRRIQGNGSGGRGHSGVPEGPAREHQLHPGV